MRTSANLAFTLLRRLPVLRWLENNFACYTCHRVRPYQAFPMRWILKFWYKSNPLDGTPGFRRRCIDCSIAQGTYRARTRISVPMDLYALPNHMLRPFSDATEAKFVCTTCKGLKDMTDQNPSCICPDCGARSRKDIQQGVFLKDGERVIVCKQCEQTSKLGVKDKELCEFCRGPSCHHCLRMASEKVWCGRTCSRKGYTISRLRLTRRACDHGSDAIEGGKGLESCGGHIEHELLAEYSESDRIELLATASAE